MTRTMGRWLAGLLLAWGLHQAAPASADTLSPPSGDVILTVTGRIGATTDGTVAEFGRDDLERLGLVSLTTATPWTDKTATFEGVPLRVLLAAVKAPVTGEAGQVVITALNNYAAKVPMSDIPGFDPLLALKRDGAYLPVRDKGPLFLVYPFDQRPEARSEAVYARSVWQIREISVE